MLSGSLDYETNSSRQMKEKLFITGWNLQDCKYLRFENQSLDAEKYESAKNLNHNLIHLSALEQKEFIKKSTTFCCCSLELVDMKFLLLHHNLMRQKMKGKLDKAQELQKSNQQIIQ